MAWRPRSAGRSGPYVGRGRRSGHLDRLVANVFWRAGISQTLVLGRAVRTHPVGAFAVLTYVVVWVQSGSGLVAAVVTPALMGAGVLVWFSYRLRRTGLGVRESAERLRRQRRVSQQWERACLAAELPQVPPLLPWRIRSEGETVVVRLNAAQYGIARDPLLRGLVAMAEVIGGGCREARCTPIGNTGMVELGFVWGSVLDNIVTPDALPAAAPGTAPYGLCDAGRPVALPILNERGECVFTPLLIAGQAGAGKSSALWAVLLGFITLGVPVRLWVADPAGGVELAALQDALDDDAGTDLFRVHRYADDEPSIDAMITAMHEAMNQRLADQKARRVRAHVPTTAEPVNLLVIDELLYLDKMLKAGKSGPLGRIQIAGRKAGYSVIGCTQLSKVADVGACRDLFLQRLVFRTVSREATEAGFGSGSGWAEKAPAHRIPRTAKGMGYAVDTQGTTNASDEAVLFRSIYLTDDQTRDIARGHVPAGINRPRLPPVTRPAPDTPGAVRPVLHVVKGIPA